MDNQSIQQAYKRYASFYDLLFGAIFAPGRKLTVKSINKLYNDSRKVLEVGVGTGLSLPLYNPSCKITGIDISQPMLDIAQQKKQQQQLTNVERLLIMDAENLTFADNSFDISVAMHVVSVVSDPAKFIQELLRITKPNGDIFILNHFCSEHLVIRKIEHSLAPLAKKIGFRPNFSIKPVLNQPGLQLQSIQRANMFGYFKLLHIKTAN